MSISTTTPTGVHCRWLLYVGAVGVLIAAALMPGLVPNGLPQLVPP